MIDVPFHPPADKVVAIDLPPPLSVNATRRVNWAAKPKMDAWKARADAMVYAVGGVRKIGKLNGKFEVRICLDDKLCRIDADNTAKLLIDYCRNLGLVVNDSKKFMRRLVIEWGDAPTGCRLTFREWGA